MEYYDYQEELIKEGEPIQGLPIWLRWFLGLWATVFLCISLYLIWKYVVDPKIFASPQDLQLGSVILFSLTVLVFVIVPWGRLGIRIRKIGAVEFDRIISGQAQEHAAELAELRARIEELEGKVKGMDEIAPITESIAAQELKPLLSQFLQMYWPKAISPLRINKWGSHQPGFEQLGKYSQGTIRTVLQDLVAEGSVVTRVSRLGNTLYRIAD